MQYFLFVNFNSGLMHNTMHKTLKDVLESVEQLVGDEDLNFKNEELLNIRGLKKHLNKYDDYFGQLSNGTWYHIQPKNIFKIVK